MAIPERGLQAVKNWVDAQNSSYPEEVLAVVRIEFEVSRNAITILECRAPWSEDLRPEWSREPVARLRYTGTTGLWTLYCLGGNLEFRKYDLVAPNKHVRRLLTEIDRDPTGIFWG
jgi:hypothetical protein